jgi:hypothetical protein
MAKKDEPQAKKPWEESDERKKALESIADEEERKAADEWDRAQGTKERLRRAREAYEKADVKEKGSKSRFFSD